MYLTPGTTYMIHLGAHFTDTNGVPRVVDNGSFRRWLNKEVLTRFENFTISQADGYWQGKGEPIRVLSITLTDPEDASLIHTIATSYCKRFNQEAVFINALSSVPNLIHG